MRRLRRSRGAAVTLVAVVVLVAGCSSVAAPPAASDANARGASPPLATVVRGHAPEQVVPAASVARPPEPVLAVAYRAALVDDHCTDRDLPAPVATEVVLTVLDRTYALPLDYVPPDLVPASEAGVTGEAAARLVSAAIVDDLAAMLAAWRAAGLEISIESAYRSAASQAATFDSWARTLGYAAGLERAARAGHSEHQLGTALDLTSPGWEGRVGDWATESAEGAWMAEHGWEYGFVMSYPAGATPETCFGYEPWHYRWVGRELAAEHRDSGLPLRTFLERFAVGGEA